MVVDVLLFIKAFRGEHKTDGTTGEILKGAPYIRAYVKSLPGMVEVEGLTAVSVRHLHIEGATNGDDYFLTGTVGMAATTLTTGHVVSPINTCDVEWYVLQLLGHGEVTTRVYNLWQVYEPGFVMFHHTLSVADMLLAVLIHVVVVVLVVAGGDIVQPFLVVEIPAHGLLDAFLKLQ